MCFAHTLLLASANFTARRICVSVNRLLPPHTFQGKTEAGGCCRSFPILTREEDVFFIMRHHVRSVGKSKPRLNPAQCLIKKDTERGETGVAG
jgi:hypothetical protein